MSADGADQLRDIGPCWLPAERALAVADQNFDQAIDAAPYRDDPGLWVPRAALLFGGVLLTVAFAVELYSVLSFVRMTPIQFLFLIFSTVTFSWIAFGSLSAAMGFLPLFTSNVALLAGTYRNIRLRKSLMRISVDPPAFSVCLSIFFPHFIGTIN